MEDITLLEEASPVVEPDTEGGEARDLARPGKTRPLSRFRIGAVSLGVVAALAIVGVTCLLNKRGSHFVSKDGDLVILKTEAKSKDEHHRKQEEKEEDKAEKKKQKNETKEEVMPYPGEGFPTNTFEPSLFCFSVMNCNNPQEIEIIKGQLRTRIGIFACDDVAVISGCKMTIGDGHKFPNGTSVKVVTWYNPAAPAPMGNAAAGDNTQSFKNADIFIRAWNMLVKSQVVFGHDWTVKADPDAVFFAYRLRWHVGKIDALYKPIYLKNCNYHGLSALYGALEVFSEEALKNYAKKGSTCMNLDWQHKGEDQWIDECMWMKVGGIPKDDFELVGDHRCMQATCEDTWRAAFHDYKSWGAYWSCWTQSINAEKAQKAAKLAAAEAKANPHFCCTWASDPSDPCNACGSKEDATKYCGSSKGACLSCNGAKWCKKNKDGSAEVDI